MNLNQAIKGKPQPAVSWKKRGRIQLKKRGKRLLAIDLKTGEVEVVWRSPKKHGKLMKNSKYNRAAR